MGRSPLKIKICGLTREEDAVYAAALGAWALGFIFYRKSPRYIEPAAVRGILDTVAQCGGKPEKTVGVFVNADAAEIEQVRKIAGINTVQIHGDETPEFFRDLPGEKWRALRLAGEEDLKEISLWQGASHILVDAAVKGAYGGTGQVADWRLAAQAATKVPLLLSGGLTPENLLDGIHQVRPVGVDVSSGVESAPGIKSPQLLKEFFSRLREA